MAIRVGAYPYGDPAFAVLARTVQVAKEADPFSPMTVVVDRGPLALSVRRRLASTPPGVVRLTCTTWTRLAAALAQRWLSDDARTLTSAAVELEAVRCALGDRTPPGLSGAREHPAALRALARTYRDLAGVPDATLGVLAAQSARTAGVVDVVRRVREALSGCVGPADLLAAAAAEVRRAPGRAAEVCGPVAVYLPRRTGPSELALVEALGGCTDVEVVVGVVGDRAADAEALELVARLSAAPGGGPSARGVTGGAAGTAGVPGVPLPTWVRSAPSADAEVLLALRHLMGRNAAGVPLERMALLHSGAAPYRQLTHDALAAAGVPAHGGGARLLSSTVAGRALLGVLALPDHGWRRDEVVAWLASAPLLAGGHLVPAAEWDALSIRAGVVSGLDQWRERLGMLAAALRDRELAARDRGGTGASLELEARRCDELRAFLDSTEERLAEANGSWLAWGAWGRRLLTDLLGPPERRAHWPDEEVVALDAVVDVLGRVGALDWLGARPPTVLDFRTALAAELDTPAPESARFGHGLLVGRVEEAIGLDLDVVCVVGMVDGAFPLSRGDDVLVPDRERERAGEEVPLRASDTALSRRDLLAVLAGAHERVLSCARYDQRHGRELRPARALLEAVEGLAGDSRRRTARELRDGLPEELGERRQFVASFADAVRDDGHGAQPVSEADWRLRSLTRWVGNGRTVAEHFLGRHDRVLEGSLAVRRARRSPRFTRFDGLVDGLEIPSPGTGAVQSATGLEGFARCPRSYFFSHLLDLPARELPETALQLSPRERGSLVHRVLERLVSADLAGDGATGAATDEQDLAAREARMLAYVDEELAEARRRGVAGHPGLWALERSRTRADLREHLRSESAYRAETGARPVAVELDFGPASRTVVALRTPSGVVRLRGRIDRVDELADGSLAVVDYKSGKRYPVAGDDELSGGRRLQLPVYALAARSAYGELRRVRASYWYVGTPAPPEWTTLDDATQHRLEEVVGVLAEGIAAGRFPGRPGPVDGRTGSGSSCARCPYDGICPPDRVAAWRRKGADPALSAYVALAGET